MAGSRDTARLLLQRWEALRFVCLPRVRVSLLSLFYNSIASVMDLYIPTTTPMCLLNDHPEIIDTRSDFCVRFVYYTLSITFSVFTKLQEKLFEIIAAKLKSNPSK